MNPLVVSFLSAAASSIPSFVPGPVPTFARSAVPTHPAVDFAPGRIRVLVGGARGGADRTILRDGDETRTFLWNGQVVDCAVVHEEAWEDGRLVERSRTFLAQAVEGTVYTFGELDDFENEDEDDDGPSGWVVGGVLPDDPEGAQSVTTPLVHTPARLVVGTVWRSEVPPIGERLSQVVATGITRTTGAGVFHDCVEILEHDPVGGEVERVWRSSTHGLVARSGEAPDELELDVLATSLGRATLSVEQVGDRGRTQARLVVEPRTRFGRLRVLDPRGAVVVRASSPHGQGRLVLELPAAALSAGRYRFLAEAPDGTPLYEEHALNHRLPDAPVPIAPRPGQRIDARQTIVRWSPGAAAVRLVVREERTGRTLSVEPAPRATAFDLSGWALPGHSYAVELSAGAPDVERGNRRVARFGFATRE